MAFDRLEEIHSAAHQRLLVVEDDDIERKSIVELLNDKDIELVTAATGGCTARDAGSSV